MKTQFLASFLAIIFLSVFVVANKPTETFYEDIPSGSDFPQGKYGADSIGCMTNLSLYREYYKQWKSTGYKSESVNDAIKPWRKAFFECPKSSQKMYLDGLKMMNYYFKKAPDEQQGAYMDTIEMIYLQRLENFPTRKGKSQKGDIYGRLGSDIMKLMPERANLAYDYLKESVALEQDDASISSLVYYFRATIRKVKNGEADETLVVDTYDELSTLIESNLDKNAKDPKKLAHWENAQSNIEKTFEPFATCEALVGIYQKKFEATPEDLDLLKKITKILRKKKCTASELFFAATKKLYELEPTPKAAMLMGKMLIEEQDFSSAAKYMEEAAEMIEDDKEKADILADLATIYYKLNQYVRSRSYAREAIKLNASDGMSYILIGDMYAASASDCGNNELTSKVAYWAAVDKYYQAKRADPELTELASKRVATYQKYFPLMETIFFHDLKEGDSYKVECWINETTTVRAAK
jgi:tetratricopeptide (TPR) repeat protein